MSAAKDLGRGAAMGLADLVPGISGGTVALLLGIHPRLVRAIAAIDQRLPGRLLRATKDPAARQQLRDQDLPFLTLLLTGIAAAILAGAGLLHRALEASPVFWMALFCGLILGSAPLAWRQRQTSAPGHVALFIVGGAVAAAITFLPGRAGELSLWFVFVAAVIAVCAMLLPGISGSGLLLLMGAYEPTLGAVRGGDVVYLAVFALGAVLGLAAMSRVLRALFARARDATLAALTGLLAGSALVVWPWRTNSGFALGTPTLPAFDGALMIMAGAALLAASLPRPR